MKTRLLPLQCLALCALLVLAAAPADAKDKEPNFVQRMLEGVTLGDGQHTTELIIFPLLAPEKTEKQKIKPDVWATKVGWSEPEFPKRRYNVGIANNETEPLLVLGGTVLGGGKRDRLVPNDVIVPVGGRVEIRTIPASARKDQRKDALPFRVSTSTAPPYLRERAEFNPTSTLVPNFVSHFLDFRNPDDKRESLSAIAASDQLTVLCLPCHESLSAFPTASGGRVIGLVTAVRGRIRSFEFFGSNRLFKAYFEPLLKSHTFAAAAIALRAKKIGLKVPKADDDPVKAVERMRKKAEKLLASLQKAKYRDGDQPKGSIGEYVILKTGNGTRGTAVAMDGELVHGAVFPHEPFENALFSRDIRPPLPGSEYGVGGQEALERRGARGTLTIAERRILNRLRGRTGGRAR